LYLQDSGGAVGNGGGILFGASQGSFAQIKGFIQNGTGGASGDLSFATRNAPTDTNLIERMRITGAGRVGIGVVSPSGPLHVVQDGGFWAAFMDAYGGASQVFGRGAAGTLASPTATLNNSSLFVIGGRGHTGSAFAGNQSSMISFVSDENFSPTANGGRISFQTTINGSTTPAERMRIANNGNVGIGTTGSPSFRLEVNGSFAATTKSFVIDHPTKEGMSLRYGSLEGPENGVYVRGRGTVGSPVELPDYWTGLVDGDSITVQVTPVGTPATLYVADISNNTVTISGGEEGVEFFYFIQAERVDVDKLVVEYDSQV
jgi:hypothetical protein